MSDFVSQSWALFVGIGTLLSIAACAVLLWATAKTKVKSAEDNTTGHVWDGDLKEMNNPLPRWWVYLFILTVIFALVYAALYPTLGMSNGQLGWSQQGQHAIETKKFQERIAPLYAKFNAKTPEELAKDPNAQAVGERLFMNYCAQCHGSDARGSNSFPNLADKDWLGDGSAEYVKATITEGRMGMMPPMGEAVGGGDNVTNVAHYVLSLSNSPHDTAKANQGRELFAACAACHGEDGKGMAATGAPNLTDDIWLHGWGVEAVTRAINNGFNNQMPAQNVLLSADQIHVLTSYVWGLSNQ